MNQFTRAASDSYAEVDRVAAQNVENGMAPREAYAAAERSVRITRSRRSGKSALAELYNQHKKGAKLCVCQTKS